MNHTITAIEHDGLNTRSFTMTLEILDPNIDILEACKEAAREYVASAEGLKTYLSNCDCFNWADFEMYVPNEICERHGFRKVTSDVANTDVDWDEQLTDEPTFLVTHIEWDTDGEEIEDLPDAYYLPIMELLDDDELLGDIDIEDIKDRVADYLSDHYGWCIKGLVIT